MTLIDRPLPRVPGDAVIYVMRHGETIWNAIGRRQGHRDSPLTLTGFAQARAVGGGLARALAEESEGPEAFEMISSPLGRCWQTAVIVAQQAGLPPERIALEPRLAEVGYGHWEGLDDEQARAGHAEAWERRERDKWRIAPPGGGESYRAVAERVAAWLSEVPAGARLIVVCHGVSGRILRGLYDGASPEAVMMDEEPQDAFFRLSGGAIARLEALEHRARNRLRAGC